MTAKKTSAVDYLWGKNIGEGAFARVVHAKRKMVAGLSVQAQRSATAPHEAAKVMADAASTSETVDVKFDSDGADATVVQELVHVEHLAVKLMEKAHIIKNDKVEYVKQEKNFLAKLSGSPWVVRLMASFQDPDHVFMVMPLAHGGTLHGVIQSRRAAMEARGVAHTACVGDEALFYVSETVAALRFLHGKGIVHRDLKPENILLMASGHLKLTDFGTALDTSSVASGEGGGVGVKDFVGTPEYVSPEVLKDEPASAAADCWGLGVIVYQIFCGRVPFTAASEWLIFQVILDHCSGTAPLTCPPSVADATAFAATVAGTSEEKTGEQPAPTSAANGSTETTSWVADPLPGTSGELVLGLLKPGVEERWTLEQVGAHPYLLGKPGFTTDAADHDANDALLLAVTPAYVPGENLTLTQGDPCQEFSAAWLFEQEDQDGAVALEVEPTEAPVTISAPTAAAPAPPTAAAAAAAAVPPVLSANSDPAADTTAAAAAADAPPRAFGGGSSSSSSSAPPVPPEPPGAAQWKSFLEPKERVVMVGPTWKRKGLFSRYRVLLLTDKPRLLYLDPEKNTLQGEIPWTDADPVKAHLIDNKHFDLVSPADNQRAYHFMVADTESDISAQGWADGVNAAVTRSQNPKAAAAVRPKSALALFGAVESASGE